MQRNYAEGSYDFYKSSFNHITIEWKYIDFLVSKNLNFSLRV